MDMLDLYSDYLIFQNKYATATGLSDLVDGAFAHDKVMFDYVLADNWFGSKANMVHIHKDLQKSFIIGIKSNRTLALSENDAKNGRYQQVRALELEEDVAHTVWLKGLDFPVRLLKKVFKNENGSTGILYLVSNDMLSSPERLYEVYQKRWRIEIYQSYCLHKNEMYINLPFLPLSYKSIALDDFSNLEVA